MLWTTGAIFAASGLAVLLIDNPLVPLSHEFQLIPIGLGGAVGTAILREKLGPRWVWAYTVFILWYAYAVVMDKTSIGVVFVASGLFSLTRAIVQTATELEA